MLIAFRKLSINARGWGLVLPQPNGPGFVDPLPWEPLSSERYGSGWAGRELVGGLVGGMERGRTVVGMPNEIF